MADEVLANFVAITGSDEGQALATLEATNWDLESAIGLYLASSDAPAHNAGNAAGYSQGGAGPSKKRTDMDETEEDSVRAPIAAKMDRLYDRGQSSASHVGRGHTGIQKPHRHQPAVDIFRDVQSEGVADKKVTLSTMFKPPAGLSNTGNFKSACERAQTEGKWLLVNVQALDQFDSHRLNRDTWSHEAMKLLLAREGMFVFHQVINDSDEGKQLVVSYKLKSLPVTMVIDPMTGAMLFSKEGFVDAERLMEDLVPFLDHGPKDPGAGALATHMSMKRYTSAASHQAAAFQGNGTGSTSVQAGEMDEEAQLNMALAMSMEQAPGDVQQGTSGGGREAAGSADEEALFWKDLETKQGQEAAAAVEAAKAAEKSPPAEVAAAAKARLPEEPPSGAPGALRVALRLPNGQRVQRQFLGEHTVQALYDLVVSNVPEAAEGREYTISPAEPGAQALSNGAAQLKDSKVAGALLAVRWLA